MVEQEEDKTIDVTEALSKVPNWAIITVALIVLLLGTTIAARNLGYGQGYTYVQDTLDDFINEKCDCYAPLPFDSKYTVEEEIDEEYNLMDGIDYGG